LVSVTPRPLYPLERDAVPIVQEAGWAGGLVWTRSENLALDEFRIPKRPTRSESPYLLRYRSSQKIANIYFKIYCKKYRIFTLKQYLSIRILEKRGFFCAP
jgi:hypothetical protein